MAADGYIALFAGVDSAESKAAAIRLSAAVETYLARCEAEAKARR